MKVKSNSLKFVLLLSLVCSDIHGFNISKTGGIPAPKASSGANTPATPTEQPSTSSSSVNSCDGEQRYLTQNILQALSIYKDQGVNISKSLSSDNKLTVGLNGFILTACSDLEVSLSHVPGSQSPALRVKNKINENILKKGIFSSEEPSEMGTILGEQLSQSDYDKRPFMFKYFACLEKKNLFDNASGFTHPSTLLKNSKDYKKITSSKSIKLEGIDKSKPLNLVFGSPEFNLLTFGGYGGQEADNSSVRCAKAESIVNGRILSENERVAAICASGDIDAINHELQQVPDKLEGIIALLNEAKIEFMKKTWKEDISKKLTEIEEAFLSHEHGENEMERSEMRDLLDNYVELLKRNDKEIVKPSIEMLDKLLKEREATNESTKRASLDKRIKKLNLLIGQFSKRKDQISALYETIGPEGFADQGSQIQGFYLSSGHYSKVYVGDKDSRGSKKTFAQAKKHIERDLGNFDKKEGARWRENYAASIGSKAPLKAASQRLRKNARKLSRASGRFYRNQDKSYARYCGDPRARIQVINAMGSGRRVDPRQYGIRDGRKCARHLRSSIERENRFNTWKSRKYASVRKDKAHIDNLYAKYDQYRDNYENNDSDFDSDFDFDRLGDDDDYSFFSSDRYSRRANSDDLYSLGGREYAFSMRDRGYQRGPANYNNGYNNNYNYNNEYNMSYGSDPYTSHVYNPQGNPMGSNAQGYQRYETGPVYQNGFDQGFRR